MLNPVRKQQRGNCSLWAKTITRLQSKKWSSQQEHCPKQTKKIPKGTFPHSRSHPFRSSLIVARVVFIGIIIVRIFVMGDCLTNRFHDFGIALKIVDRFDTDEFNTEIPFVSVIK